VTALEVLLAEERPDGTFAGPRSRTRAWTSEQQAQHRADLIAALDGTEWHQPIPTRPRKASR